MSTDSANERKTVFFRGHVQGVGFRYTTHAIARGFDVTGYVRNLDDGRVELVAEGVRHELAAFLDEVRERLGQFIRGETVDTQPATEKFTAFEIRH